MKSRKQAWTLFILLAVIAVLVIVYAAMTTAAKNKQEKAGHETNIELYSLDIDKADKIEVTNLDGSFTFEKKEDTWQLTSEKNFSLDEAKVESMLSAVKTIQADRLVVEKPEDLDEYGLDKPQINITVELKDGVSSKIELGDEVPVQGGYYALVDGESKVYVMDENYYTSFSFQKSDLVQKEDSATADEIK